MQSGEIFSLAGIQYDNDFLESSTFASGSSGTLNQNIFYTGGLLATADATNAAHRPYLTADIIDHTGVLKVTNRLVIPAERGKIYMKRRYL